MLGPTGRD